MSKVEDVNTNFRFSSKWCVSRKDIPLHFLFSSLLRWSVMRWKKNVYQRRGRAAPRDRARAMSVIWLTDGKGVGLVYNNAKIWDLQPIFHVYPRLSTADPKIFRVFFFFFFFRTCGSPWIWGSSLIRRKPSVEAVCGFPFEQELWPEEPHWHLSTSFPAVPGVVVLPERKWMIAYRKSSKHEDSNEMQRQNWFLWFCLHNKPHWRRVNGLR